MSTVLRQPPPNPPVQNPKAFATWLNTQNGNGPCIAFGVTGSIGALKSWAVFACADGGDTTANTVNHRYALCPQGEPGPGPGWRLVVTSYMLTGNGNEMLLYDLYANP